jgi:hypothetical protein
MAGRYPIPIPDEVGVEDPRHHNRIEDFDDVGIELPGQALLISHKTFFVRGSLSYRDT